MQHTSSHNTSHFRSSSGDMANKRRGNVIRAAAGGLGKVTVIVLIQRKCPKNAPVLWRHRRHRHQHCQMLKKQQKNSNMSIIWQSTTTESLCVPVTHQNIPSCPCVVVRQSTGRLCDCPAVCLSGLERITQEVFCPATSCYCVQTERIPKNI